MLSAKTHKATTSRSAISGIGPRSSSTRLAVATRGALILAGLLLMSVYSAHAQVNETVLYNFCYEGSPCKDGVYPQGRLTPDGKGNFYGVTIEGGDFGAGVVFELSPNGNGGWNENPIYSFDPGPGGFTPAYSYVIFDSAGNLYGTASSGGGANYAGVVFELSPGESSWTETVLYDFAGSPDGASPYSGLVMDPAGDLYGVTHLGGASGNGTVFEVSPSGGGWTERVIYNIADSDAILGGLAIDSVGNIFGNSYETVFELIPNGNVFDPHVIHTFAGSPKDGSNAFGTPVLDGAGNIYGTTNGGGAHESGTVYQVSPAPHGKWKERILYSFKDGKDGGGPGAGVVLDADGNIYGTTTAAGKYTYGTVFELAAPLGKGSYKETTLWNFTGTDGEDSLGSLILDRGNLYGTAERGGSGAGSEGDGVVFEVTP
jgi:uncharacterized repeat protein (TIGR03803 family)